MQVITPRGQRLLNAKHSSARFVTRRRSVTRWPGRHSVTQPRAEPDASNLDQHNDSATEPEDPNRYRRQDSSHDSADQSTYYDSASNRQSITSFPSKLMRRADYVHAGFNSLCMVG